MSERSAPIAHSSVAAAAQPSPSTGQVPNIDDYIEIWWEGDRAYYRGRVVAVNSNDGTHKIHYDDGETEYINMRKESWRLIRAAGLASRSQQQKAVDAREQQHHHTAPASVTRQRAVSTDQQASDRKKKRKSRTVTGDKSHLTRSSNDPNTNHDTPSGNDSVREDQTPHFSFIPKKQAHAKMLDISSAPPVSAASASVSAFVPSHRSNAASSPSHMAAASASDQFNPKTDTSYVSPSGVHHEGSKQETTALASDTSPADIRNKDLDRTASIERPTEFSLHMQHHSNIPSNSASDAPPKEVHEKTTAVTSMPVVESSHAAFQSQNHGDASVCNVQGITVPTVSAKESAVSMSSDAEVSTRHGGAELMSDVPRGESVEQARRHDSNHDILEEEGGWKNTVTSADERQKAILNESSIAPNVGPARKRYSNPMLQIVGEKKSPEYVNISRGESQAGAQRIISSKNTVKECDDGSHKSLSSPSGSTPASLQDPKLQQPRPVLRERAQPVRENLRSAQVDHDATDTDEEMDDFETPVATPIQVAASRRDGPNVAIGKRTGLAMENVPTDGNVLPSPVGTIMVGDPQLSSLKRRRVDRSQDGTRQDAARYISEMEGKQTSTADSNKGATSDATCAADSRAQIQNATTGASSEAQAIEVPALGLTSGERKEKVVAKDGDARDILSLDHVMTAVVQATVMILDQRLRPIADRLEELGDELRQYRVDNETSLSNTREHARAGMSTDEVAEMMFRQHTDHSEQIDRLRKEIKKIRSDHRAIVTETWAMREAELKQYFDDKFDLTVKDVSRNCAEAALSAASSAATTVANAVTTRSKSWSTPVTSNINAEQPAQPSADGDMYNRPPPRTKDKRQRSRLGSDIYSGDQLGDVHMQQNSPSPHHHMLQPRSRSGFNGQSQSILGHTPAQALSSHKEPQHHRGHYTVQDPHLPRSSGPGNLGGGLRKETPRDSDGIAAGGDVNGETMQLPAAESSRRFGSTGLDPRAQESHSGHVPIIDDVQLVKNKALHLVARQVTVWLLETQHECRDLPNRAAWAQETASKCLYDVSERLRRFKSYTQAFATLSASLGDDNVELDWFVNCPHTEYLRCARRNYAAWDPPPSNEEWALEELLLSELSERFHAAILVFIVPSTESELVIASAIARLASSTDTYSLHTAAQEDVTKERVASISAGSGGAAPYGNENPDRRQTLQPGSQKGRNIGSVGSNIASGFRVGADHVTNTLPALNNMTQPEHGRGAKQQ